ncbi:MAG: heliorhodopsin HeR [Thermoleophilia bacterium]|nr:heliorhodopsin HeR [Thermoleophilia bacterium]
MNAKGDGKKNRADDAGREGRLRNLRWWNVVVGLVLAVEAVVLAVLANDFKLPVTATYMQGPPGTEAELTRIGGLPLAWGTFAFMAISAVALLTIASPGVFGWYKRNLLENRNYGRWIEYSISSSLMIVLITMVCGITDIAAMLAIFGVNASMILFGLLMEKYENPGKPNWLSFWFGSFAGIIPWIAIVVYLASPGAGGSSPPGFVWAILISYFVFFMSFAVNMFLQYKQVGRWRDYLFGEKVYILLSLTSKSLLTWLVFANTLIPD